MCIYFKPLLSWRYNEFLLGMTCTLANICRCVLKSWCLIFFSVVFLDAFILVCFLRNMTDVFWSFTVLFFSVMFSFLIFISCGHLKWFLSTRLQFLDAWSFTWFHACMYEKIGVTTVTKFKIMTIFIDRYYLFESTLYMDTYILQR